MRQALELIYAHKIGSSRWIEDEDENVGLWCIRCSGNIVRDGRHKLIVRNKWPTQTFLCQHRRGHFDQPTANRKEEVSVKIGLTVTGNRSLCYVATAILNSIFSGSWCRYRLHVAAGQEKLAMAAMVARG